MQSVCLVDTDIFSYLWQDRPESRKFRSLLEGRVLALSFTSVAEAYKGAYLRQWSDRKLRQLEAALSPYLILPYDREMSRLWGAVWAQLSKAGRTMSVNDLWIAVTALHYGIPLVTNNLKDFQEVPNLVVLP